MKNRVFALLISTIALTLFSSASGAEIGTATRNEIAQLLTRIVSREVSTGYLRPEQIRVRVQGVEASRKRVRIFASIGLSYYPFRQESVAALRDSVRGVLPEEFRKASIELYTDRHEIGELIPLASRRRSEVAREVARGRIVPFTNGSSDTRPLVVRLSSAAIPTQGLLGRHIALWQSHGRYFDQPENRWKWQRARMWQTCEDLYTQSYVLPYLVPMLERAGACVLLPRERDVQRHEALSDNDRTDLYAETGTWETGGAGFAHRKQVYLSGENPFRDGTTRRTTTTAGEATAQATWQAEIPERGEYGVYVSYETTPGSADDARYTVHHLGGETRFAVNQTMGGGTWIYLGRFPFEAGRQRVVTLSNASRQAGRTVSADAVKLGGGYGNVAREADTTYRQPGVSYAAETSGYPRFCEGSRYWLQWAGFDERVYTPKQGLDDYKDDYMSRAEWVNALLGGSPRLPDSAGLRIPIDLALAFHSDAGVRDDDETIGTLGIYYTRENGGRFAGGADRYRSRDLTDLVQSQVVDDIRRTCEPAWSRRGLWNRAYYEARVPGAPTMLLELLSHNNFADMRLGSDPRFRFLVSRAVYKGILRYISSQYGLSEVTVQPLPVEAFAVTQLDGDRVKLTWSPVRDSLEASATPTGYVVYTRIGDGGFDNGRYVETPHLTVTQRPGTLYSYRVAAVNAGGESFPSETLAAYIAPASKGRVLIVNGFDRVSAPLGIRTDTLTGFLSSIDGGVPDRLDISYVGPQRVYDPAQLRNEEDSLALGASDEGFATELIGGNTFDYPALHGRSVAAAGYSFCSASVRAVERGEVSLDAYEAVDLILGKQRATTLGRGVVPTAFAAFSPSLQRRLRDYVSQGGGLLATGCYVASDLWDDSETTLRQALTEATAMKWGSKAVNGTEAGAAETAAGNDPAAATATAATVVSEGAADAEAGINIIDPDSDGAGDGTAVAPAVAEGQRFAREVLHVSHAGDAPVGRGRMEVMTAHGAFSRGDYRLYTDLGADHYTVERVGALEPTGEGAFAVMRYGDNGLTAAVAYEGPEGGRRLIAGFPFEAIPDAVQRNRMMRDALRFIIGDKHDR